MEKRELQESVQKEKIEITETSLSQKVADVFCSRVMWVLLVAALSFSLPACRTQKNVKTPMGWLSNKKLKKPSNRVQKQRKTHRQTKANKQATQQWYRDWGKDGKK